MLYKHLFTERPISIMQSVILWQQDAMNELKRYYVILHPLYIQHIPEIHITGYKQQQ